MKPGDVPLHRPSRNPVLTELARWLGHLETAGGWLAPFDDARPTGWVAPPFEALVGLRTSTAWGPSVREALGGSVRTDPIVIAAVALSPTDRPSASPMEWLGGVAHLRGTDGTGSDAREALLIAEDDFSANGNGHERADPLSVVLGLGGRCSSDRAATNAGAPERSSSHPNSRPW